MGCLLCDMCEVSDCANDWWCMCPCQEINEKRRSVQDRLDELGEGVPLDTAERVQVMWTLVTDYCEMFKNTIRGWDELVVGALGWWKMKDESW